MAVPHRRLPENGGAYEDTGDDLGDDGGLTEGLEEEDEDFSEEEDSKKLQQEEREVVGRSRGVCDEVGGDNHGERGWEGREGKDMG